MATPWRMIAPAPRNPIPVTIWAAIRVGSARMALWPEVRNSLNPYAETIVNSAEPTDTSRCVRRPASRSRSSRSSPSTPPRAAARATRPSTSGQPSVGRLDASSSTRGFLLRGRDPLDPHRGELEQLVQLLARERLLLSGRLNLDEPSATGHDDVHVDLGGRVFCVVEIEQRLPADDADRDRCDGVGQRLREPEPVERQPPRDAGPADRRAAGAAGRLQHIAVEPKRPLAERLEVCDGAQRTSDQPLDLDRSATLLAARGLTLRALAGRRGQQRILSGHPAASFANEPARDTVLDRCGA